MMWHYRNGQGRTACRLLSDSIKVTKVWTKVDCKNCLNSIEASYALKPKA
jgi:hypothetical protein